MKAIVLTAAFVLLAAVGAWTVAAPALREEATPDAQAPTTRPEAPATTDATKAPAP